jgi:hypothetical protein
MISKYLSSFIYNFITNDTITDYELAKNVDKFEKTMLRERDQAKKMQEHKDSNAALQCAIEERREQARRAQAKREMEEKDVEYAKKTILDEVEESFAMEKLCERDLEYAAMVRIVNYICCSSH